jgi:hypothetical protein
VSAAAAILVACSGARQSQGAIPPIGTWNRTQASEQAAVHGDLLYATGSDRKYLYVMTYPKLKLIHTIGGFNPPNLYGACSDLQGNVYVTDYGSVPSHTKSHVFIYKHGATTPTRMLAAPPGIYKCAVDPVSGDLAVITVTDTPALAIYRKASGSPTLYDGPHPYTAGAYDDNGNLYLAGAFFYGDFPPSLFANGTFTNVTLNKRLPRAVDLQWYNGVLVYTTKARRLQQKVYRIKFSSASVGHTEPAFRLERGGTALPRSGVPDLVVGNTIMATGLDLGQLDLWNYPQGGEQKRSVTEPINAYFSGLALSSRP